MSHLVVNQVCVMEVSEDSIGLCTLLDTGLCVHCGNNIGNKTRENKKSLFELGVKIL